MSDKYCACKLGSAGAPRNSKHDIKCGICQKSISNAYILECFAYNFCNIENGILFYYDGKNFTYHINWDYDRPTLNDFLIRMCPEKWEKSLAKIKYDSDKNVYATQILKMFFNECYS